MRIDFERIRSKSRKPEYQNSSWIAKALLSMNDSLEGLEEEYLKTIDKDPKQSVVLISFLPRSGSTFLFQLLTRTGKFNYVSNFQSRFWRSPCIGRLIEETISPGRKYDQIELKSEYGRTHGFVTPAEFNYFWEEHLGISKALYAEIDPEYFTKERAEKFRNEILGIISLENKPLLFKREYLLINLSYLKKAMPNIKVIHIERNFDNVVRSYLKALDAVFPEEFPETFGTGTPDFKYDSTISVESNVRNQLKLLEKRIFKELETNEVPYYTVSYEDLCEKEEDTLKGILSWLGK